MIVRAGSVVSAQLHGERKLAAHRSFDFMDGYATVAAGVIPCRTLRRTNLSSFQGYTLMFFCNEAGFFAKDGFSTGRVTVS